MRRRLPSVAEILRLPPGDRGPRLRMLERDHLSMLGLLSRRAPCLATTRARVRHEKALRIIANVARAAGIM